MKPDAPYYIMIPDIAGELGGNSVVNRVGSQLVVSKLHFEFDDWDGDVLIATFPSFIITEAARKKIEETGLTGARFDEVEVTVSDVFEALNQGCVLPKFVWLKVEGERGRDDFALMPDGKLIVSHRALHLLRNLGVPHARVTEA